MYLGLSVLFIHIFLIFVYFHNSLSNEVLEISGSSDKNINTIYICSEKYSCHSLNSNYKLTTTYAALKDNSIEKRWYIHLNNKLPNASNYSFGTNEISSRPLKLNTWKKILYHSNQTKYYILEPNMMLNEISPKCNSIQTKEELDLFGKEIKNLENLFLILNSINKKEPDYFRSRLKNCQNWLENILNIKSNEYTNDIFLSEYSNEIDERISNFDRIKSNSILTMGYCEVLLHSESFFASYHCFLSLPNLRQIVHQTSLTLNDLDLKRQISSDPFESLLVGYPILFNRNSTFDPKNKMIFFILHERIRLSVLSILRGNFSSSVALLDEVYEFLSSNEQLKYYLSNKLKVLILISHCLIGKCANLIKNISVKSLVFNLCGSFLSKSIGYNSNFEVTFEEIDGTMAFIEKSFGSLAVYSHSRYLLHQLKSYLTSPNQDYWDLARSFILTLNSMGNFESSVNFFYNSIIEEKVGCHSNPNLDDLKYLFEKIIQNRDFNFAYYPDISALVHSSSIKSLLILHKIGRNLCTSYWESYFSLINKPLSRSSCLNPMALNSNALSLYLDLAMQVANPVILDFPISGSVEASSTNEIYLSKESIFSRILLHELIDWTFHYCKSKLKADGFSANCHLKEPFSSVGSRGLFLIAYQGLASPILNDFVHETYFASKSDNLDFLLDYKLPSELFELIRLISPEEYTHNSELSFIEFPIKLNKRRIAFCSNHFRDHSVGKLMAQIISNMNMDLFEVLILLNSNNFNNHEYDQIDGFLKQNIVKSNWIHLPRSISIARELIFSLDLDVIVFGDVFMDAFWSYLVQTNGQWGSDKGKFDNRKFASNSILFWGHPFTSGNPHIDYFITSDLFESNVLPTQRRKFRQNHFTEQLVHFDSLSFKIFQQTIQKTYSEVRKFKDTRDLLSICESFIGDSLNPDQLIQGMYISEEYPLLHIGVLQSLMKFHPLFDIALIKILVNLPNSLLFILKNDRQFVSQFKFARRLSILAREYEIKIDHRVFFVPQMAYKDYMDFLCRMDVSLDPFPFGGGVTLTDLFSGYCKYSVPFVTSGLLQSVHPIGSGIAKIINDSKLAINIDTLIGNVSKIENINITEMIDIYAQNAITLALSSKKIKENQATQINEQETMKTEHNLRILPSEKMNFNYESVCDEWNNFIDSICSRV